MSDLLTKLNTTDFGQYSAALGEIREVLKAGDRPEISNEDFMMLLRPYYWFTHSPGFQDVYDTYHAAMVTMQKNVDNLLDKETNPITGNEFLSIGTFLAGYLDDGTFDPSGWKMLFASPEIATSVTADKFAGKLEETNSPADDVEALQSLANLMRDIEGSKHVTYWCLRRIGADFVDLLRIVHSFPTGDQSYILHALDAFPGNEQVIDFYKQYIETTEVDFLKEAAEEYLETVIDG